MNEQILGNSTSYFIVGRKDESTFPVHVNGFSVYRANDIQSATLYQDRATVVQTANLLTMFAELNGDSTVFEGRKQTEEIVFPDSEPDFLAKLRDENKALEVRLEAMSQKLKEDRRANEEMTLGLLELMMSLI